MATFALPFYSLRVIGHFGSSGSVVEQFNYGLKLKATTSSLPLEATKTAFLTAIQAATSTFHASTAVGCGTDVFLDKLTCAKIGTDGKYVGGGNQPTTVYLYGTPVAGTVTSNKPWSTSFCLGLRTNNLRGLASNGRVYIPATGLALTSQTGQWSTATVDGFLAAARTWINQVVAAATANFSDSGPVVVASQGGQHGGPRTEEVIALRGDGRPDHNETREKQMASIYRTSIL